MTAAGALSVLSLCWRVAGRLLSGATATVVAATMLAPVLGLQALTVRSGSMTPSIGVGDVVVDRVVPAASIATGDVVTFTDPTDSGRLLTHRVQSVADQGATLHVITKGDANDSTEDWVIEREGRAGLVLYRVPKVGYGLGLLATRYGRLGVVGLLLLVGIRLLVLIWHSEPEDESSSWTHGAARAAHVAGADHDA